MWRIFDGGEIILVSGWCMYVSTLSRYKMVVNTNTRPPESSNNLIRCQILYIGL